MVLPIPNWNRRKVFKALGFFPVVFTLGLLGWSLIAHIRFTIPEMFRENSFLALMYSCVWAVLWALTTWSYFICVFRNPGNPNGALPETSHRRYLQPPNGEVLGQGNEQSQSSTSLFRMQGAPRRDRYADRDSFSSNSDSDYLDEDRHSHRSEEYSGHIKYTSDDESESNIPLTEDQIQRADLVYSITVKDNGQPRFCHKCNVPKPDRTHHCSICGVCVLKMDHHCPWLNNCVGFRTQKAFLLFIIYGSLYCIITFIGTTVYFIRDLMDMAGEDVINIQSVLLIILSAVFSLCLLAFSGFHIYLVLSNLTTIESYERNRYRAEYARGGPSQKHVNLFNLGSKKNFYQVFGPTWYYWFIPSNTTLGDGVRFPVSIDRYNELQRC